MIFEELRRWWRLVCRTAVIVGVVLAFFTLIEVLRAYQTLAKWHQWAGYGFLIVIGSAMAWAGWSLYRSWRQLPKVLIAPAETHLLKYSRYLIRYLRRLENNELLDEDSHQLARQGQQKLQAALRQNEDQRELQTAIQATEEQHLAPILKKLDQQADRKIRNGVRDIMMAVTLSPYRSVDILIVIYRNLSMLKNVALVYNSRPRLRESLAILYDTARVVATVNFVNLGSKMVENLTKGLPGVIPGVGRIVDDCAEGLAAGILTSLTGHAAQDRCRAFRKWSYEQARANIATHLKTFTADVGMIFFKDIIPQVRIPGGLALEKWKQFTEAIGRGFNDTVEAIQQFVHEKAGHFKKDSARSKAT